MPERPSFFRFGAILTAALLLAGCGGGAVSSKSAVNLNDVACRSFHLRIAVAAQISAATGQNPLPIMLTNRGERSCLLKGYPGVALLDARGATLPFRISHRGDQIVTPRPPVAVRILPDRSGFFVLNKCRCDLGNVKIAKKLHVVLPGVETRMHLTLMLGAYPIIAYCGRDDPGSIVTVSPIEPTLAGALARK